MSKNASESCPFESQSFVLRMRVESSKQTFLPAQKVKNLNPRIWVRIEHVNQGNVRQFSSVDDALGHLRKRMKALSENPSSRLQKEFPDV